MTPATRYERIVTSGFTGALVVTCVCCYQELSLGGDIFT